MVCHSFVTHLAMLLIYYTIYSKAHRDENHQKGSVSPDLLEGQALMLRELAYTCGRLVIMVVSIISRLFASASVSAGWAGITITNIERGDLLPETIASSVRAGLHPSLHAP